MIVGILSGEEDINKALINKLLEEYDWGYDIEFDVAKLGNVSVLLLSFDDTTFEEEMDTPIPEKMYVAHGFVGGVARKTENTVISVEEVN